MLQAVTVLLNLVLENHMCAKIDVLPTAVLCWCDIHTTRATKMSNQRKGHSGVQTGSYRAYLIW